MLREALTSDRLRAMTPGEASAYFVARADEGLTGHEQDLLAEWLAADQAHPLAFDRAQRAWRSFDGADGNEILTAMRNHARGARPKSWSRWPRAAAVAAMLIIVSAGPCGSSRSRIAAAMRSPGCNMPRPVARCATSSCPTAAS